MDIVVERLLLEVALLALGIALSKLGAWVASWRSHEGLRTTL